MSVRSTSVSEPETVSDALYSVSIYGTNVDSNAATHTDTVNSNNERSIMFKMASLSEQGWVSDGKTILANVVSNYLLTDAAQSLLFSGSIISLPQTYYLHIHDPDAMASAVNSDLTRLLSYYFAQVDVSAIAKQLSGKQYAVALKVSVISDEGVRYDLARIMEIDSDSLRKIIELANYGDIGNVLNNY